ncbi:MAG: amidohydrolase [Syntrophomonadaceae bacterium]|nr:amidohydrolase [Syntrophomonadaceae bacterium]
MKTLIKNVSIIPMDGDENVIEKGYIIIEDDTIKEVKAGESPQGNFEQVIDGTNQVALPGFINTHTHAAMTLLRGYADDLPLKEWLETKIWPMEDKLTGDDIYWGTMLAIVEMIKSGTTTFMDMYFHMDRVAEAVNETGIRAVISRGMIGVGPENERAITESLELIEKWHQAAGGRIQYKWGPHAPYTCPPDYLRRVLELAEQTKTGIHIHISETSGEYEDIKKQYGKSPVELLQEIGLFSVPVVAAHCVHLSDNDIEILKNNKVGVAHNPESNMKLASGIAPVPEMLTAGIAVGLGTDGTSSNNNLDMIQEMRSCALLHKVNAANPTVIPAYQALQMATRNGAEVLGLTKQTGSLTPGLKADIILMNLNQAHMTPCYDLVANLVYASQASDVETVIVDGRILMQNRQLMTINETEVIEQCRAIASRLTGV